MMVSVLAVGTELVVGQTVNKNASWLSDRLKQLGIRTALHLTVPDDRSLILAGLNFCAAHSEIILVTGGLGPTTDDFTRDLISEWAEQALEFDEASWQKIKNRMSLRKVPVQDFQKQQCFFPQAAQILQNSEGTANGFQIRAHGKDLIALPGPPREINAIWTASLYAWFTQISQKIDKHLTWSWDTFGLGESQIMQLAEAALSGHPFTEGEIEIGYRVHGPRINFDSPGLSSAEQNYVEVKLSCFESQRKLVEPWINRLELALKDVLVPLSGKSR
ncbi:MAG: competence/damage-inducible protein A [Bdellovibrionales bacterium]|nr:competence/damage-inducible protein A [Bdellovibrionales bacterium]